MKNIKKILFLSVITTFMFSCSPESNDFESFEIEEKSTIGISQNSDSERTSKCSYALSILDEYIDGTQGGANFVYLKAGGNYPSGTTYAWEVKRQDGSIESYPASTSNPRLVSASINNRITEATVTAVYGSCGATVTKVFNCAIPHADENGNLFPECN